MRRRVAWALALALCVGGTAACGGDDDDAASGASTSSTTSTTTLEDPAAAVDEFCAKTDEFQAILAEAVTPDSVTGPTTTADQSRMSELTGEIGRMQMEIEPFVAQMLPGDAARFRECASVLSGLGGFMPG